MKRVLWFIAVAVAAVGAPAAGAQTPAGDSISGSGTANVFGPFQIDVRSGPGGENPTGQASFDSVAIGPITGSPTCLAVTGNLGIVNLQTPQFGVVTFEITDNAGSTQPDTLEGRATGLADGRLPGDCSPVPNGLTDIVVEGDVTVVDAPEAPTTKDQCKNGGWRSFGTVFRSQGDCVSFVARGGRPAP